MASDAGGAAVEPHEEPEISAQLIEAAEVLSDAGMDVEMVFRSFMSHSGPLPAPADLEAYERIMPGLAERIVARSEREQTHRHAMDRELVEADMREDKRLGRGQWLGIAAAVVCATVAVFALVSDEPEVAGIVMGTTIVSLAGVFVVGRLTSGSEGD